MAYTHTHTHTHTQIHSHTHIYTHTHTHTWCRWGSANQMNSHHPAPQNVQECIDVSRSSFHKMSVIIIIMLLVDVIFILIKMSVVLITDCCVKKMCGALQKSCAAILAVSAYSTQKHTKRSVLARIHKSENDWFDTVDLLCIYTESKWGCLNVVSSNSTCVFVQMLYL